MNATRLAARLVVLGLALAALALGFVLGHDGGQAQGGLAITMTDAPDPVAPGGTVVYRIEVENTGTEDEGGVVVTDEVTGPATIVNATPSQGRCDPPQPKAVTCFLGTLAGGGDAEIVVEKLVASTVGGTVELLASGSDAPVQPVANSGASVPYAAVASGIAAAGVVLAAGGWYARRRLS